MNDSSRIIDYVENSFLGPLLQRPDVTDVSFNGTSIFYEDRFRGRRAANISVDNEMVGAFLRQLANFAEKQFSYMNPKLDIHFGRYRLNAMFFSVCRVYEDKAYSFALRVGREGTAITEGGDFFPPGTRDILLKGLQAHESIVIAGETGSGKTELQKYLLLHLPDATRVIVIDNIGELELCRGEGMLDLTFWQVDERYEDARYSSLIRNALRNNPDYLILAEARGGEMVEALSAAMSGHPIITTIHAKDLSAVPFRMARLAQGVSGKDGYEDVLSDIFHHFSLVVYLRKENRNGQVLRYVQSIGRLDEKTRQIETVFERKEGELQ